MKLLGRLHQRTSSKNDKAFTSPPRDRKANNGQHEEEDPIIIPNNHSNRHRHPSAHLGKHNSNRSSMAFSKYGDDTTLDGNDNNTLYDWSVADNAPSLGSAGELFAAKHNHKYKKTNKRRFLRSGYGSSSDEEDDFDNDDDDDGDDNEMIDTVNYQYAKLSDSPPPKSSSSAGTATATDSNILNESEITLRTGNKKNSNDHTSTKRAHTKEQKDSKFLWNKKKTKMNASENVPVDVDQFIGLVTPHHVANNNDERRFGYGKENVGPQKHHHHHHHHRESNSNTTISNVKAASSSSSQPSKVTGRIKPQIHCGIDDIQDAKFNALYDSSVVSSGDGTSTRTSLSMKNLTGSTSPYSNSKLNSRNNYAHASFSKLDQKMIPKNVDPNFRINSLSRDIGGTGTDWLLNDKASSRKRHQLEHERLQNEIQNDKYQMSKVKAKAKKSIKTKMKKKIISLVGTKQKGSDLKGSQSERGILPKAKLSRNISEFSMEPLTGIEGGFVKQDAKTRKEILTEIQHRRNIERQEVQKSEYEVKRTISRNMSKFSIEPLTGIEDGFVVQDPNARKETLLEMKHRQNVERQEAYKNQVARRARSDLEEKRRSQESLPRHEVPTQQLNQNRIMKGMQAAKDDNFERHRNKEKLQQWVSRFSQLSVDGGIGRKEESTSYLSSCYTIKSNESASRIDKSGGQKSGFASSVGNKGAFAFETNFPDEDSSAQSPFDAAPPKNESSFTCVICKKGERTHLASPCMHFSFCGDCVNKLQQNGDMRCVVCDSQVSTFSKVFF